MRILLVEDDPLLGEGIQTALRRAAVAVDWLTDGAAALAALRDGGFDVVVLDLGLPRLDGLSVIRAARAAGVTTPVLVLTARDRVADRVQALDLGADDYLGKPFDPDELLARIRALHRRASGQAQPQLGREPLLLDPVNFGVRWHGRPVDLPRREFALLRALLEQEGRIVGREALQQRLYGWDDDVASNSLVVHVHHLRRKLDPALIRTVRGVGYSLVLPAAAP
ncbi:MAG: response regulator [Xanthomonadaceae bacterium]|jgi:two-component system OmpR family response regulator/two-component system response regulator QseB|nr:response regulator [Xanthomonadaceae bacterium]